MSTPGTGANLRDLPDPREPWSVEHHRRITGLEREVHGLRSDVQALTVEVRAIRSGGAWPRWMTPKVALAVVGLGSGLVGLGTAVVTQGYGCAPLNPSPAHAATEQP